MKNNSFIAHLVLSLILIAFIALCFYPLQQLLMPTMFSSIILIGLAIVFVIFAIFVWREKPQDEREEKHRLIAGRVGFLVGAGILVAGIVIETLKHELDSWLLLTLAAMILGKLLATLYYQTKN